MKKILLVEDEVKVSGFISKGLIEKNYKVDVVFDGQMGLKFAIQNHYDLIILDLIIPIINGFEVCKRIKAEKPKQPIIMLTALGTTTDKLQGFDAGADDYLVKPFEFAELLARIRVITNRNEGDFLVTNKLVAENLELDINSKSANRGGKKIELTSKEFALLEFFLKNKNKVLSRAEISEKVWDIHFDTGTNIVDVYVNILRKKIDQDFEQKLIQTKIGHGYILSSNN